MCLTPEKNSILLGFICSNEIGQDGELELCPKVNKHVTDPRLHRMEV